MTTKPNRTSYWLMLVVLALGIMVLGVVPVWADNPLPPRDPSPQSPGDGAKSDPGKPVGAYIELVAPGAPNEAWAVVQWQDVNDDWQVVKGWRGTLNNAGSVRWWVAAKDFGTGPFRWVVMTGADEWGSSEPFYLPAGANEILQVMVEPAG